MNGSTIPGLRPLRPCFAFLREPEFMVSTHPAPLILQNISGAPTSIVDLALSISLFTLLRISFIRMLQ